MPFSVLLVCTGNTCRSAMAEGILKSLLEDRGRGRNGADLVHVLSAGTAGLAGFPATDSAISVAREHGIDISGHLSRALTGETIDRADLILAMTRSHLGRILENRPDASAFTFQLSEFADGSRVDVPDPIGDPREEYEKAYTMMDTYLRLALPRILEWVGEE
ncbi:MAG: low molecular weight protein arginine phosphatase [Candidatus Eisenbacteria bacterium]|nr:low molecular weight protein arginine phosphatase [Candidatus Eisenbacteria bacterium]